MKIILKVAQLNVGFETIIFTTEDHDRVFLCFLILVVTPRILKLQQIFNLYTSNEPH